MPVRGSSKGHGHTPFRVNKPQKKAPSRLPKQRVRTAETNPVRGLAALPNEMVGQVLDYLDPAAFLNTKLTAKRFHALCSRRLTHEQKIHDHVPPARSVPLPNDMNLLMPLLGSEATLRHRLSHGTATVRTWHVPDMHGLQLSPDGMFACTAENAVEARYRIEREMAYEGGSRSMVHDIEEYVSTFNAISEDARLPIDRLCNVIFASRNLSAASQRKIKQLICDWLDVSDISAQAPLAYRLWDARTPQVTPVYVGGSSYFTNMRFSQSGRYVIAVDRAYQIVTFEPAAPNPLSRPPPGISRVLHVSVGDDGTGYVAFENGVWSVEHKLGAVPRLIDDGSVYEVFDASRPWAQQFIINYDEPDDIEFAHCDARGPQPRITPLPPNPGMYPHMVMDNHVVWQNSPETVLPNGLFHTDLRTLPLKIGLLPEPFSYAHCVPVLHTGNVIAVCREGTVTLRDLESGKTCTLPANEKTGGNPTVVLAHNGQRVALINPQSDWKLTLWDTRSDQGIEIQLPCDVHATDALFSPDDDYMVTAGPHGVHIWDLAHARPVPVALHVPVDGERPHTSFRIDASRDGRAFVVSYPDDEARLFHFGLPPDKPEPAT